ncbi:MAG: peptidyl-prolyl cis-trans isomerase [Melioribacteraceae bacterium]|nr:peptidyl-prolyl cis-trans isomerase [Melioribacteraceae bacterium]
MKLILKLLLPLLIISSSLYAQYEDDKIIAEVGSIKITAGEFKKRYEMVPHIGRHIKGREERLKAETLYSIIAEKLWAIESEALGFDSTDIMKYTFKNITDMNLRDALYRKEILDKVTISPEVFNTAKRRSLFYLNTKFIHSMDEVEITNLSNKIRNGASFDSLLVIRPEYELQKNNFYQVHFGQMSESAEDLLYNLTLYEISDPIKSPEGWYIFKLYSIDNEIIENAKQARNMEKNIKRITEVRADENVYQKFYKSFFPGHKITTDGELFWSFSNKVINSLNIRKKLDEKKAGESVHLTPEDFMQIKREFGSDSLAMPFIHFEESTISMQQFIYSFAFEGFYSAAANPNQIRGQLDSRVKRFIEHELLAKEAKRQGLENLPEVKSNIKMWRDNYLSTLYKQTLFDSSNVTDSEVEEYFAKSKSLNGSKLLINIIEIFSDNLEVIESVFNELGEGTDFRKIASEYAQNENSNLESGLVSANSKGEIGRIAKDLNIGEIYGPIKTENGYVIFKLIDKKREKAKLPREFDEIKHQLKIELKSKNISNKMIDNTVKLANKYGVKVNEKLLYNLPVTNYNMMVYRYMGFGGRMIAVPLTPTFIEWVEKWQKSKQDLP